MSLFDALTTAVLPVLSIAAAGFLLGRVRDVRPDALATVTMYVLSPALVFSSLATSDLGGEAVLRVGVGVIAFTVLMLGVTAVAVRATDDPESVHGAAMLTSAFPNAGNYGIPLSAFAFGAVGRSTAVLYIAAQALLMYTVGVYIASRGAASDPRDALVEVVKLPLLYAVAVAGAARWAGVVPPADTAVMQTITLTGNAAIPVMLLMLGIQLANTAAGRSLSRVRTATVLKLFVAPAVALGVAALLGFDDSTVAKVFVLECAMPAAVTPLMLTVEFSGSGSDAPEYVSTAILVTTLGSLATLTVLVSLLQRGLLGV